MTLKNNMKPIINHQLFITLGLLLFTNTSQSLVTFCPPTQYLVQTHHRNGYVQSDGTAVRPTTVKAYCKFRNGSSEFLKDLFKKGQPANLPHQMEKDTSWTEEERERIVDALEFIPNQLLSPHISGVYRLKKSKDFPNPASNSNGVIVIYDSAFTNTKGLERIMAHELAHQSFRDLSEKAKQDGR